MRADQSKMIREMLWACRMTQPEAARKLGLHKDTMARYATGRYRATKILVYALRYLIAERARKLRPHNFEQL